MFEAKVKAFLEASLSIPKVWEVKGKVVMLRCSGLVVVPVSRSNGIGLWIPYCGQRQAKRIRRSPLIQTTPISQEFLNTSTHRRDDSPSKSLRP